jgi:nucleotide-binding universal stress UspA family protein
MLKVLLPVDGSESAMRATRKLIETISWYKEPPRVDLLTVHLPLPRYRNMNLVVSDKMIESYYSDESDAMLAESRNALDAAGVKYTLHKAVGPIAETIVAEAARCGSDLIFMGTRGMTAVSNMALGSIATKVLHLVHIPVVLVH